MRRTKIYFRLDFFLVSTEFHLDAAGFYLQLSERAVSVASKDSAFRECLARRQTVESFSLDEIENRGKKAHDTHSVRTHEIKTDLFSSIILIALGVFRTRGKRLSLWKTWIAICPLCVCMCVCVCDCFQTYHRYHIKSCCSKSFATFN